MPWLDRLLGHPSLTAAWVADPSIPLVVDLAAGSFCGVALGAPIARLQHLGPASAPRVRGRETQLVYGAQGMTLVVDAGHCLEAVDLNLVAEPGMAAFGGRWMVDGEPMPLDATTPPAAIMERLGPPDDAPQAAGSALAYRRPTGTIWFEWGVDGALENVLLDRAAGAP